MAQELPQQLSTSQATYFLGSLTKISEIVFNSVLNRLSTQQLNCDLISLGIIIITLIIFLIYTVTLGSLSQESNEIDLTLNADTVLLLQSLGFEKARTKINKQIKLNSESLLSLQTE